MFHVAFARDYRRLILRTSNGLWIRESRKRRTYVFSLQSDVVWQSWEEIDRFLFSSSAKKIVCGITEGPKPRI